MLPQNNYTQIPHCLMDDYLACGKIDVYEFAIMSAIARRTIGWHKLVDSISAKDICKMTGISENTVRARLLKLNKLGLIMRDKVPGRPDRITLNIKPSEDIEKPVLEEAGPERYTHQKGTPTAKERDTHQKGIPTTEVYPPHGETPYPPEGYTPSPPHGETPYPSEGYTHSSTGIASKGTQTPLKKEKENKEKERKSLSLSELKQDLAGQLLEDFALRGFVLEGRPPSLEEALQLVLYHPEHIAEKMKQAVSKAQSGGGVSWRKRLEFFARDFSEGKLAENPQIVRHREQQKAVEQQKEYERMHENAASDDDWEKFLSKLPWARVADKEVAQ